MATTFRLSPSPSSAGRRVRRNQITTNDAIAIGVIAAITGVVGGLSRAEPTAWIVSDLVVTAAFAAFVCWAGASAPWWVLTGSAAVATIAAPSLAWAAVGLIGFGLAAWIGGNRANQPVVRSVSASCAVLVLMNLDLGVFHGSSALIAGAVGVAIGAAGVRRRNHLARRAAWRLALGLGAFALVALVGVSIAAAMSYGAVRDGERALRAAASALSDGELSAAADQLEVGEQRLGEASDAFRRPWSMLALMVPVLGQHVDVVSTSLSQAQAMAATGSITVEQVNLDSLQIENGVIDLVAIELLAVPLAAASEALTVSSGELDDARTDWLVEPLASRYDEIRDRIDDVESQAVRGLAAVDVAPAMLGKDGERTYFVAFTTPAESRGLGGFMGTWAELSANGGRLKVTRTGPTNELTQGLSSPRPILTGPPDYLARYGQFGAGGGDTPVSVDFWSNFTLSPDFPSIAAVASELYPESGGVDIDGVIALDVETIARFLDLTGPIEVEGPDGPIRLTESNAASYLLRGQYEDIDDDDVRDDVLDQITMQLLSEVFGGSLPGPRVLATTLGPSISSGQMVVWSLDGEDQEALHAIGVSGQLPAPSPDGLAVVSNNAGANKLDAYLKRSITYEALIDESTGGLRATVTIRLANDAPEGLASDAGGNPFGLPDGTNRMYLSIYSPWDLTLAEANGETVGYSAQTELGWQVYSIFVDIPRSEEIEIRLGLTGVVENPGEYGFTLRSQPLTFPDVVRIDVGDTSGNTWVSSQENLGGVQYLWRL
ncbi:MAG: hypothetical protein ACJAR2_000047 [Ilumatobacter sp.]|jgi:hypothetical protein